MTSYPFHVYKTWLKQNKVPSACEDVYLPPPVSDQSKKKKKHISKVKIGLH